ncbi:5518_t:CDS:2, partial [Entrophospora sp. SA101]
MNFESNKFGEKNSTKREDTYAVDTMDHAEESPGYSGKILKKSLSPSTISPSSTPSTPSTSPILIAPWSSRLSEQQEQPPRPLRRQLGTKRKSSPLFQSPERSSRVKDGPTISADLVDYLYKKNEKQLMIGSHSLTQKQMKDLVDKFTWLSSDHINAYFTILNSEYGECVYAFSTYFYAKLMKGDEYSYSRVIRWTKKIDIFKKKLLFVPININASHWILAVIIIKERKIELWDSLGIEWTANNKFYKKTPQLDDHSCGVFVCMFAKLLSAGLNDDKVIKEAFDMEKIKNFRILMAEEILYSSKPFTAAKESFDQEE